MATHQIIAIRKPNRNSTHEHITHAKYDGLVHPVEHVIRGITNGTDTFYVKVGGAMTWVEVVRPSTYSIYIRTRPDWTGKDNLLSLPEC